MLVDSFFLGQYMLGKPVCYAEKSTAHAKQTIGIAGSVNAQDFLNNQQTSPKRSPEMLCREKCS